MTPLQFHEEWRERFESYFTGKIYDLAEPLLIQDVLRDYTNALIEEISINLPMRKTGFLKDDDYEKGISHGFNLCIVSVDSILDQYKITKEV